MDGECARAGPHLRNNNNNNNTTDQQHTHVLVTATLELNCITTLQPEFKPELNVNCMLTCFKVMITTHAAVNL